MLQMLLMLESLLISLFTFFLINKQHCAKIYRTTRQELTINKDAAKLGNWWNFGSLGENLYLKNIQKLQNFANELIILCKILSSLNLHRTKSIAYANANANEAEKNIVRVNNDSPVEITCTWICSLCCFMDICSPWRRFKAITDWPAMSLPGMRAVLGYNVQKYTMGLWGPIFPSRAQAT